MSLRTIAVDWSGAVSGARRKIWLAEAVGGQIMRLESGRDRSAIADFLIGEASRTPELVVGLDFAFSMPGWFLESQGMPDGPALWDLVAEEGESWLAGCEAPFWGRPGRGRPELPDHLRRTDRDAPAIGGIRPKSVFQIGGAGAVGTGSLRGMPVLKRLRDGGFAVWPFDAPRWPCLVEIYPRLLTGAVNKGSLEARTDYLATHHPALSDDMLRLAATSEDAFDAAVSALAMDAARAELINLGAVDDLQSRLEGQIWAPVAPVAHSNGQRPAQHAAGRRPTDARDLETWRRLIETMLPVPVVPLEDGSLIGGDPGEVVADIRGDEIRVSQYVSRWIGHSPEPNHREVARFDPGSARPRDVARAIARARGRRLAAYRWCSRCHEMQPPEWMHDVEYCQGCATECFGVVY
jgi:hypothetical protein